SFRSSGDPEAQLDSLVADAHALSPLWSIDTASVSNSTAALADFIDDVALSLRNFADNHESFQADGLSLFVSQNPLGQSFVNGVAVTGDLPLLDDYAKTKSHDAPSPEALPSSIRLGGDAASTGATAIGETEHGVGLHSDQSM